jgi:hypothetical protein
MENALREAGFKRRLNWNVWIKDNWTIRFSVNEVEIFDDPVFNTPGKYYKGYINDTNILDVLEDIEKFISESKGK